MTEPVFVDTNVLVYALDERDPPGKQGANRPRTDQLPSSAGMLCTTLTDMAGSTHGGAGRSAGSAGVEAGGRGRGDS